MASSQDLLSSLPTEIVQELAKYLNVHDQNSLLQVNRDLYHILMPGLLKATDDYGNDRYLLHLIKTGNKTELAAWPGHPSSTLFNLAGRLLTYYQQTANRSVQIRMRHLNPPLVLFPCLRIDKSGLMVAVEHGQWEVAAFLLRRDGAFAMRSFLGTREHFYHDPGLHLIPIHFLDLPLTSPLTFPPMHTLQRGNLVVQKPPMWEHFSQFGRLWEARSLQGGTSRDVERLLKIIQCYMDEDKTRVAT